MIHQLGELQVLEVNADISARTTGESALFSRRRGKEAEHVRFLHPQSFPERIAAAARRPAC